MEIQQSSNIPVLGYYDVIVAGAGPAGISTAITSARLGKSTLLIERYGVLGGCLTSGLVGPIMGNVAKGTIFDEINSIIGGNPSLLVAFDTEQCKIKLTGLVSEAGVTIYLQAPIVDVIMDNITIVGVVVGTPEGVRAVMSKIVVDATGDATVAYLSGAPVEKGRAADGLMQPVSLMLRLGGIDESKAISEGNWTFDVRMPNSDFKERCVEASKAGELPEYAFLVRLYRTTRTGECIVNATQSNYVDGTLLGDISRAEIDLRAQINVIVKYLRKTVSGFENCYLQDSANTLGIRETRRVIGEYVLTADDVIRGAKFHDAVVHDAWFHIDIHNITGGGQTLGAALPYDIPYRCFVPLKIENLLACGRCISGTHEASASYRIMTVCLAMGEAAGIAAALSVNSNVTPRNLNYKEIQNILIKNGVKLFG